MGHAALRTAARYTYRDTLSWPEGERCELIEGVVYAMAPAPSILPLSGITELTALVGLVVSWEPIVKVLGPE